MLIQYTNEAGRGKTILLISFISIHVIFITLTFILLFSKLHFHLHSYTTAGVLYIALLIVVSLTMSSRKEKEKEMYLFGVFPDYKCVSRRSCRYIDIGNIGLTFAAVEVRKFCTKPVCY